MVTTAVTPNALSALSVRSLVVMGLILLAVFGPVFYSASIHVEDYDIHLGWAFDLKETGDFTILPHWIYYVLVIAFSELLPNAEPHIYSWLAVLLPYVILGLLIFVLLDRQLTTDGARRSGLAGMLTLTLLSITPIFALLSLTGNYSWTYVLGYLNPSPWHSPTQNVLKLWIIPVSLFALRAVSPTLYAHRNERIGYILLSALLVILMTFTKPNYTLCLLPGLGLFALYKLATRNRLDWPLLILGIGLPAVGVLAFQYLNTFGTGASASVAFGFLTIVSLWDIPNWQIPVRLLLSIAFPLVVYLLHFRSARRDDYLNLSWLIFLCGLPFMYALNETGYRLEHGNFIWGAYAGLFGLMFASVAFLIREYKTLRTTAKPGLFGLPWRLKVVGAIFILHMSFGIFLWLCYLFFYPVVG